MDIMDDAVKPASTVGLVLMLDALGVRGFDIDACTSFIDDLKEFQRDIDCLILSNPPSAGNPESPTAMKMPIAHTYGDTVLYTLAFQNPDDEECMWNTVKRAGCFARMVVLSGLRCGIRFRGAMSIGKYVESDTHVIGPAVADAATWYEETQWIGVIATPTLGLHLNLLCMLLDKIQPCSSHGVFVRYNVPLHSGRKEMWAIASPVEYAQQLSREKQRAVTRDEIMEILFQQLCIYTAPKGTEDKYSNTIEFFDWYLSKHNLSSCDGRSIYSRTE